MANGTHFMLLPCEVRLCETSRLCACLCDPLKDILVADVIQIVAGNHTACDLSASTLVGVRYASTLQMLVMDF